MRTEREGASTRVLVSGPAPDADCTVIALELDGPLVVYHPPEIGGEAAIFVGETSVPISPARGISGVQSGVVRYTLDGSTPGARSPIAGNSIRLTNSATITARTFIGDRPVSGVSERRFERVEPLAGVDASSAIPGLRCLVVEGDFRVLPDFAALPVVAVETVSSLPAKPRDGAERTACRFSGLFHVEHAGIYRFALTSDDGSRLTLHDRIVVDNDGLHGEVTKSSEIALAAGWHPIVIDYFNRTGGSSLGLTFGLVGAPPRRVAPDDLRHLP